MSRGVCMMLILLDHTEMYYVGRNIIPYNYYVANALAIFFIISGFLFYKKNKTFSIKHKIKSIFRKLIIPYFIFTSAIAIPKALVHGDYVNVTDIVISIFTGGASWFVSALIVAEIVFLILIFTVNIIVDKFIINYHSIIYKIILLCIPVLIISLIGINFSSTIFSFNKTLYDATVAIPLLYCGFIFHVLFKNSNISNKQRVLTIVLFIIMFIIIKVYENHIDANLTIDMPAISSYPLLLFDSIVGFIVMRNIMMALHPIKMITWTGSHSLVYYFLCGGVPLLTSMLFNNIGLPYDGNYVLVIIAFTLVYVITSIITWLIYKYIPFVTGSPGPK